MYVATLLEILHPRFSRVHERKPNPVSTLLEILLERRRGEGGPHVVPVSTLLEILLVVKNGTVLRAVNYTLFQPFLRFYPSGV